jgi:hypothetical protein
MRRDFMRFVDAHPAEEPRRAARSPYLWIVRSPLAYSLALFLVLGSTVYAAEGSLPQEALYPLKTDVIEPIAVQLAPLVGISRGDARVAVVERRLEEAETLVDQGDLSTTSASILAAKISESSSEARRYASSTAEHGHTADALDTNSKLETLLEAHGDVLTDAADDQASTTTQGSDTLIGIVQSQGDQTENASEHLEEQLGGQASSTETQSYLVDIQQSATSTIAELEGDLSQFAGDADLANQASAFLSQAKYYYQSGLEHLDKNEDEDALSDLREAQSDAEKGAILLASYSE